MGVRPTCAADSAVARKIARLAAGRRPRVLDLFSGCGGISLGFHSEGYTIAGHVEIDPNASRSFALNFWGNDNADFALRAAARDISRLEPEGLAKELGLGPVPDAIDVIVGGPPCQAFSRVGRAKLRHLAKHPHAFQLDERRDLYHRYVHYVAAFKPLALLMENVPDILNQGGSNVMEEILTLLRSLGYEGKYSLINAASHGVPQMRDRVYMVAFRRELQARIEFPKATHYVVLPSGYAGARAHALRAAGPGFLEADHGSTELQPAVTAEQAIGDLPFVSGANVRRGPRRFGVADFMRYPERAQLSQYAVQMRSWLGFEASAGITDHAIRFLPRDGAIFARMPEGAEYPVAHAVALALFEETAKRRKLTPNSPEYNELRARTVPPYDPGKFPNKWWKIKRNLPVRTLMAHLGKDGYSHIHYDSRQARTISVREAARLQSFPDGWRFAGAMNSAFQQIGNAVPPLMAAAIARTMKQILKEALSSWRKRSKLAVAA